jgi:hypothetical protein
MTLHDIMNNPNNYTLDDLSKLFDHDRDVVFVEDEGITERYFNPDAESGFQFVTNWCSFDDVLDAYGNGHANAESFWYRLDDCAVTYLFDISEHNVGEGAYRAFGLMMDPYDMGIVRGANREADMHELMALVKQKLEWIAEEA